MIDVPEETACLEDAKNLVVCSDGTGNSVMKGRGTNVFKLYEAGRHLLSPVYQGRASAVGLL